MTTFTYEYRVPWQDVDLAGIVYFPRYFSYFEMAEQEWIREEGFPYDEFIEKLDIWMPRVAVQSSFHSPARLGDLLSIEMKLGRRGRSSFTLAFDAYRIPERKLIVDGTITIATVSRSRFKPIRIPKLLSEMLAKLPFTDLPAPPRKRR